MSALSAAPAATPSAPAPAAAAPAPAPAAAPTPVVPVTPAAAAAAAPAAVTPAPGFAVSLPQGEEARYGPLAEMMKGSAKLIDGQWMVPAQGIVDFSKAQLESQEKVSQADLARAVQELKAEYANDPEIGGAHMQETEALIARATQGYKIPEQTKKLLDAEILPGVKLSDHPGMKALFRHFGTLVSPDSIAGSLRAPGTPTEHKSMFSDHFLAQLEGKR